MGLAQCSPRGREVVGIQARRLNICMRIHEITHRPRTRSHQPYSGHHRRRTDADERAYHAAFKPYLRCETEHDVPQPIFIAAMAGVANLRMVPVPASTWKVPEDRRDEILMAAIRQHYRRAEGRVPTFGKIRRYSLVVAPGDGVDLALPFDVHGNRAGPIHAVSRLGEAVLSVGGQNLSRKIWSEYGRDR
jgi:hypothetical protein